MRAPLRSLADESADWRRFSAIRNAVTLGDFADSSAGSSSSRLNDSLRGHGRMAGRPAAKAATTGGVMRLVAQIKAPAQKSAPGASPLRTPAATPPGSRGPAIPPATIVQFNQATEIATLAAEKGMADLSFRAIRESLRPGPPVLVQTANSQFGAATMVRTRNMSNNNRDDSQIVMQVARKLTDIVAAWKKAGFPAENQYAALAVAVFPEGRPGEIGRAHV